MTQSAPEDAQQSDSILIAQANSGKRQAFDELMRRHEPRMTNLARRTMGNNVDAEDALQEAMASAWFKLSQFDQTLPFGPWITRIVLNKCRDQLRKRKVMRLFDFGLDNEVEQVASNSPDQ
ncbi:MAG: sigma-70 family RNA polymerase sigma factor [Parasphingorhabdus sp.]|uniref:RNA polymerase sigma factor n=1 Tax=Parasphingorhabdus sp. TaxID=2709688 RepID=UPI0030013334